MQAIICCLFGDTHPFGNSMSQFRIASPRFYCMLNELLKAATTPVGRTAQREPVTHTLVRTKNRHVETVRYARSSMKFKFVRFNKKNNSEEKNTHTHAHTRIERRKHMHESRRTRGREGKTWNIIKFTLNGKGIAFWMYYIMNWFGGWVWATTKSVWGPLTDEPQNDWQPKLRWQRGKNSK